MMRTATLLLSLCFVTLTGCSTASIKNTWKDPSVTGPIQFKKTVALVIHPDGTVRRAAEEELAKQMGDKAVPAYSILDESDRQDVNKLKAKLQAAGVDGAVTMKLLGKRNETTYVPGSPGYGGFYDYYGGYGYAGSPGYVVTDTIATVETRIYNVTEGKLLWMGTSETFNPSDIRANVRDIAKAVGDELRKEKLLVAESK